MNFALIFTKSAISFCLSPKLVFIIDVLSSEFPKNFFSKPFFNIYQKSCFAKSRIFLEKILWVLSLFLKLVLQLFISALKMFHKNCIFNKFQNHYIDTVSVHWVSSKQREWFRECFFSRHFLFRILDLFFSFAPCYNRFWETVHFFHSVSCLKFCLKAFSHIFLLFLVSFYNFSNFPSK